MMFTSKLSGATKLTLGVAFVFAFILAVSIASSQVTIYDSDALKDQMFPSLTGIDIEPTGAVATFRYSCPFDDGCHIGNDITTDFIYDKDSFVTGYRYEIEQLVLVEYPTYETLHFSGMCNRTDTINLTQWQEPCDYYYDVQNGTESRIEPRYQKVIKETFVPKGTYNMRFTASWKASTAPKGIDWIPVMNLAKTRYPFLSKDLVVKKTEWAWINSSWAYKQELEVNQTGTTTIEGVPILVNGTGGVDLQSLYVAGKLDAAYRCLRFVNATEDGLLSFGWENYSSSTHGANTTAALIWLRVDSIPSTNTTVFMYYDLDCDGAGIGWNSSAVFPNSEYLFVGHNAEEQGTTSIDEVGKINGTFSAATKPDHTSSGKIGYSYDFEADTSNEWVLIGTSDPFSSAELASGTMEAWFYPETIVNYPTIFNIENKAIIGLWHADNTSRCHINDNTPTNIFTTGTYTEKTWYYIACSWNGTGAKVIKNNNAPNAAAVGSPNIASSGEVREGADNAGTNYKFDGYIDEMRLHRVYRSDDWLRRQYDIELSDMQSSWEQEYAGSPDEAYLSVALNNPANDNLNTTDNISFVYTPTIYSTYIANCSLWENWTSSWNDNTTNATAVTANSTNSITIEGINDGEWLWNVECYNDTAVFASANYTLTIDTAVPTFTWNTPVNNSVTQNESYIYYNITVSETPNHCMLQLGNGTNYSMTVDDPYCYINLTQLVNNTVYVASVVANDTAGNENQSSERWVTVNVTVGDWSIPQIDYVSPTLANESLTENYHIYVNASAGESLYNCTLEFLEPALTSQSIPEAQRDDFEMYYYFYTGTYAADNEHPGIGRYGSPVGPTGNAWARAAIPINTTNISGSVSNATINFTIDDENDPIQYNYTVSLYYNTTFSVGTEFDKAYSYCHANSSAGGECFNVTGTWIMDINLSQYSLGESFYIDVADYINLDLDDGLFWMFIKSYVENTSNTTEITYLDDAGTDLGFATGGNYTMTNIDNYCYYNVSLSNPTNLSNYYFRVWGTDFWNNQNMSEDRNITFVSYADVAPPTITWNTPANNTYTANATYIYYNATISETPDHCMLALDNGTNYSMTIDGTYCHMNLTQLVNNTRYIAVVYANDTAGNENWSSERWVTVNLTSDVTAPAITFSSPDNTSYSATPVNLNVTVSEDADWCMYRLNSGSNITLTNSSLTNWNIEMSPSNGLSHLVIWCNDTSANWGYNGTVWFTTDTAAPSVSRTSPANSTYNTSSTPDFVFNATEYVNTTVFYCEVLALNSSNSVFNIGFNDSTVNDTSTNITSNTTLADDEYSWWVRCYDGLQWTASDYTWNITIDTAAPTVLFVSPTADNGTGTYNQLYITWNQTVSEQSSNCIFTINETNQTGIIVNESSTSYCYYNETGFTTNVTRCATGWAEDDAGNHGYNSSLTCITTSIPDITPPTITIHSPSDGSTYTDGELGIQLSFSETIAWWKWNDGSTNNVSGANYSHNTTVSGLGYYGHWSNGTDHWLVIDGDNEYINHTNSAGAFIDGCELPATVTAPRNLDSNITTGTPTHFWVTDRGITDGVVLVNWTANGSCELEGDDTLGRADNDGYGFDQDGDNIWGVTVNQTEADYLFITIESKIMILWNDTGINREMENIANITAASIGCDDVWGIDAIDGDEFWVYCDSVNNTAVRIFTNGTVIETLNTYDLTVSTYSKTMHADNASYFWLLTNVSGDTDTNISQLTIDRQRNQTFNFSEASHNIYIYASDTAGNIGYATAAFTVDLPDGGGGGGGGGGAIPEEEETVTPPTEGIQGGPDDRFWSIPDEIKKAIPPLSQFEGFLLDPISKDPAYFGISFFHLLIFAASGYYIYASRKKNKRYTGYDYLLMVALIALCFLLYYNTVSFYVVNMINNYTPSVTVMIK